MAIVSSSPDLVIETDSADTEFIECGECLLLNGASDVLTSGGSGDGGFSLGAYNDILSQVNSYCSSATSGFTATTSFTGSATATSVIPLFDLQ